MDKNLYFRTMLLHAERIGYSYGLGFILIPFSLDVIRIYSGPMPVIICWWHKFFKNFFVLGQVTGVFMSYTLRVSKIQFSN